MINSFLSFINFEYRKVDTSSEKYRYLISLHRAVSFGMTNIVYKNKTQFMNNWYNNGVVFVVGCSKETSCYTITPNFL